MMAVYKGRGGEEEEGVGRVGHEREDDEEEGKRGVGAEKGGDVASGSVRPEKMRAQVRRKRRRKKETTMGRGRNVNGGSEPDEHQRVHDTRNAMQHKNTEEENERGSVTAAVTANRAEAKQSAACAELR